MSSSELSPGRNPPWTRDELIIALDLYLRHRDRLPGPGDPEILEASQVLNRLGMALRQNESFRNANSVYMKLGNFRSVDPEYLSQGKKGLSRGGKGDREVWDEFADSPSKLAEVAAAIRATILSGESEGLFNEPEGIIEAAEGRLLTRVHVARERNARLIAEKKRTALRDKGALTCEGCGFDYEKAYGERGRGFIEAHHILPVHLLTPGSKTRLEDLALVCANCHRMIHARRPWLTLAELKASLNMHHGQADA